MAERMESRVPADDGSDEGPVTYEYLRIGIILAVVMLAISVVFERGKAPGCWQTSISAYYHTPVRPVLIGVLMAIGLCLIVIKGRKWEDFFLNVAGMLAPVVALVPTSDAGNCASIRQSPDPKLPGDELAPWVVANIRNNLWALLLTGVAALVFFVALSRRRTGGLAEAASADDRTGRVTLSLLLTIALVLIGVGLYLWTDWFETRSHGVAAIAMFVFLFVVVVLNMLRSTTGYRAVYGGVALAMVISVPVSFLFGGHKVFALEALEIAAFAIFWAAQTREKWRPVTAARAAEARVP